MNDELEEKDGFLPLVFVHHSSFIVHHF